MNDSVNEARAAIATDLEESITSLLGLDEGTRIDRQKRLEAIGLDSLLAMDLLASLQERYGSLPESLIQDCPTLDSLADFLSRKQQPGS